MRQRRCPETFARFEFLSAGAAPGATDTASTAPGGRANLYFQFMISDEKYIIF